MSPIFLIIIFFYLLFSPKLGLEDKESRCNLLYFYIIFGFIMGFYDGFLGPGTGIFWVFFLTYFLGYNFQKATAYTKVFNLNSSLIATVCFALGSNIDYRVALCMSVGQILGGKLGAHYTLKNGVKLIRPIFTVVVFSTIISLFYKNYNLPPQISSFFASLSMSLILLTTSGMIGIVGIIFALRLYKRSTERELIF